MLLGAHCPTAFSIGEARRIVADLFEPSPLIYWSDFIGSMVLGGVGFRLVRIESLSPVLRVVGFVLSCLAYYRAALFIHELIHLKRGRFTAFRVLWNLCCGIPFLMPSFLYYTHLSHHARKHYGTREDGEYLPLGVRPAREILIYLLQPFVIPILAILRFLILTPLAWISPTLRRWIHQRASSMVMDPSFVRPLPSRVELRYWRLQETGCFLYTLAWAALLFSGFLPWTLLLQAYAMSLVILFINAIRTLGAHRFRHGGEELTFVDQLLDSVNYPKNPILSGLWAPVGLRFHALHHVFPSLPYHSLAEAHHRLMRQLPADSAYRLTESPGLFVTLRELWTAAKASRPAEAV